MFYSKIKRNEFIERVITDILYADMEGGEVGFLKQAYDKLGLDDGRRILQMRKKYNKISPNMANVVHEDIIGIIVEEICRKGNKELYDDLMAYYLGRFPYVMERFENNEDKANEWMEIYDASFDQNNSETAVFVHKSFVLLYCVTYGKKWAVKTFLDICKEEEWMNEHYGDGKLLFYDRQKVRGNYTEWMCEEDGGEHISQDNFMCDRLIKRHREYMASMYCVEAEEIEEFFFDNVLCSIQELQGTENKLYNLRCDMIHDSLNDICKKFNITQLEFWDTGKRQDYIEMIRKIYSNWCKREICNVTDYDANEAFVGYGNILEFDYGESQRCITELAALFWFENFAMNLQKFLDKYYENFSFDSHGKDHEELCKANASLTEELSLCKEKLKHYADAEVERRHKEYKDNKKDERQYIEKIAALEKKLEGYEKEMIQQKEMISDRDTYIDLLEAGNDLKVCADEVDVSKFYSHRILFVGGHPEMVSRLKHVFSTATFMGNETMPVPQKIDLIVLLTGYMNHAMFYKYIRIARDKGIRVVYCNGSNIDVITMQVAGCL